MFGFEKAGILFKDDINNVFYSIHSEDYNSGQILEENIVRYPMSIGISGKSAMKEKIMISAKGEHEFGFSSDIDNFLNISKIDNFIIGPMVDTKGNIRGILQLFNKKGK
jgi:hypothetical protein